MLIEILKRTPTWVYFLFLVLGTLGYLQSKDRTVSRSRVSILPAAMFGLSFFGVVSAFGFAATTGIAFWATGSAIAVVLGVFSAPPHGVTFSQGSQSFSVPGSWLPLTLMMALFFTKFAVGVILARQLPIAGDPVFVSFISLCYGFFGGLFLARAIVVWRSALYTSRHFT